MSTDRIPPNGGHVHLWTIRDGRATRQCAEMGPAIPRPAPDLADLLAAAFARLTPEELAEHQPLADSFAELRRTKERNDA